MEIILKIPRENVDLSKFKNILIDSANSLKQEKEFRQVFIVFDVDPY
jgi:hypothetical protein